MKKLGLTLTLALGLSACGSSGGAPVEEGCKGDGDCPRGEVCEAGACVPAPLECEGDADCDVLEICTDDECVAVECKADSDCVAGTCAANVCVNSCLGSHDQTVQCDNDMSAAMWRCYDCRLIGASCPDGVQPRQTPIAECLNVALDLSFDCGTCYQAYSACLIGACTIECNPYLTGDPESCGCVDCGLENCDDEFEACAKFRMSDGVPECPGPPDCTP